MAVISNDIKESIKDSLDAEVLLKSLGFVTGLSNGSDVRAACIIHGGDNPTGFSMKEDTKTWRCFTRQCEQDASGGTQNDVFALVMRVLNVPFVESVKYLANLSGLNLNLEEMFAEQTVESRHRRDTSSYIKSVSKLNRRHRQLESISEDVIKSYTGNRDDYFLQCGFTAETLSTFEIGAMFDNQGVHRATIPVRDATSRLVGISARRTDGDAEPRYKLGYGFKKGSVLYNLHNALQTGCSSIIIVEGFKACWAVHEAGFKNVVACMGKTITDEQVLQLCSTGFTSAVVLLDGDTAGVEGSKLVEVKLSKSFNTVILTLPKDVSPDDITRTELRDLVEMYLEVFK